MNTIANFFNLLYSMLLYVDAEVRYKAKIVFTFLGAIVLALVITATIAFLTKWEPLVITVFGVSSLFFLLLGYFATQVGPAVIDFIADFVPGKKIRSGIGSITKEIRKIFFPLCTISLICAFGAVHVSIRGTGMIGGVSLWVVFFIAWFCYIHAVYRGNKSSNTTGAILSFLVIVMIFNLYVGHSDDIHASKLRSMWNGHIVKVKEEIAAENDMAAMNHGKLVNTVKQYWVLQNDTMIPGHFTTPMIRNTPLMMARAKLDENIQRISGIHETLREVIFKDGAGLYSDQSLKCYMPSRFIKCTNINLGSDGLSILEGELKYSTLDWIQKKGKTTLRINFDRDSDTLRLAMSEKFLDKKYKLSGHVKGEVFKYNPYTGEEVEIISGFQLKYLPAVLVLRGKAGASTTLIVEI